MDIWSGLPPEQQQAITSGQESMTVLNKCETAEHWYLVGNALSTMQQAAMTYGNTNKPTGKSFNAAWASLAEQAPALKLMDKAERSNAIWLATEWHLVKPWLDTLTGSGKRELNHSAQHQAQLSTRPSARFRSPTRSRSRKPSTT